MEETAGSWVAGWLHKGLRRLRTRMRSTKRWRFGSLYAPSRPHESPSEASVATSGVVDGSASEWQQPV